MNASSNDRFHDLMGRATRLARGGDPQAATRAIQEALGTAGSTRGESAPHASVVDVLRRAAAAAKGATVERAKHAFEEAFGGTGQPGGTPDRGGPRTAAASDLPNGARVLRGTHASRHGKRDYRLYVPSAALRGEPLPLVVMLHGCTQDADDFARGTRMDAVAEARGAFVLYPEQSKRANPQGCWNWFKGAHQTNERGEPAIVAGMLDELAATHPIDASRVYAAGLSAGGAMAAILGECAPERFAAVGVHSGLGAGAAHDVPSAFAAMQGRGEAVRAPRVPTIVFHGDADRTVAPDCAEALVDAVEARLSGVLPRTEAVRVNGRHCERTVWSASSGHGALERWRVRGAGHAWFGGDPAGSYAEAEGPHASELMLDFFLAAPVR